MGLVPKGIRPLLLFFRQGVSSDWNPDFLRIILEGRKGLDTSFPWESNEHTRPRRGKCIGFKIPNLSRGGGDIRGLTEVLKRGGGYLSP